MSLAGHVRPQRPSTSLGRHALEALSVTRPSTSAGISAYTADNSFGRMVSIDIGVKGPAQVQSALSMRPGTAMSKTKIQNKIVRLEPFVTPPSRSSARERYVQKGGAPAPDVEVPLCAAWCQRRGPHLTSLVLDSPRAPDFNPVGSCSAPVTCAARTCTTCTFSAEMCP
jgi:hypothetical protein